MSALPFEEFEFISSGPGPVEFDFISAGPGPAELDFISLGPKSDEHDLVVADALAIFSKLKINTRGRLIEWVRYGRPDFFEMIDNWYRINESAAPFRALVNRTITDDAALSALLAEMECVHPRLEPSP